MEIQYVYKGKRQIYLYNVSHTESVLQLRMPPWMSPPSDTTKPYHRRNIDEPENLESIFFCCPDEIVKADCHVKNNKDVHVDTVSHMMLRGFSDDIYYRKSESVGITDELISQWYIRKNPDVYKVSLHTVERIKVYES